MIANLDDRFDIINIRDDVTDSSGEVNKKYFDQAHMTPSGQQKDAFRYLMEDADQSSSENNISVTGIIDFDDSPHLTRKLTDSH